MCRSGQLSNLSNKVAQCSEKLLHKSPILESATSGVDPFIYGLTAFILACFVGYFVVWKVTPALHTPLMAVTNAVSGVIVVGAIIALGSFGSAMDVGVVSFFAVLLASVNIFGGFVVTWRMLEMFRRK